MRVLICGGRDKTREAVFKWLEANFRSRISELKNPPIVDEVIHGRAPGADMAAGEWALRQGFSVVSFPADWKKLGSAAGPIRNQRMIDEGKPDVCIAFPGGRGTADMVARAEAAGIPVIRAAL